MTDRAIVIGAGVGGLCAAARLARAGVEVTVLERGAQVGGKMRVVPVGGQTLDVGPTVLTMRWVFDALFDHCGGDFSEAVPLARSEVIARHAWGDGSRLDLFADVERSADAIGAFAGAAGADGYRRFLDYARAIYDEVEGPFIRGPRPTPMTLVKARGLKVFGALRRIDSWRTVWSALGSFFPDPRLRQLFGRYATYCGSSPFQAPATLNLIAWVEQAGVWQVVGGIHRLARAIADLAEANGATIRCDAEVAEVLVSGGRAGGVRLSSGEVLEAEVVVVNADRAALPAGLLGGGPVAGAVAPAPGRSLSALTWAMTARVEGWTPAHHNVAFSDDSPQEFDDLFGRGALPADPTVYVCAQDRGEGATPPAPGASERLFVLVNAPARGDAGAPDEAEIEACRVRTFDRLARCGLAVHPEASVCTGPTDWEARFPGTGGALYGAPTHGWRASLQRPGARTRVPGLYLAGGGVHPGPGVPMVALSGQQAADAALADIARGERG